MKRNAVPFICRTSSIVSRVVPAMSLTIALSSFKRAFSRVDFPALGFPIIATLIPFFTAFPYWKLSIRLPNLDLRLAISPISAERSANSTSSSAKSSSNSISEVKFSKSPLSTAISLEIPPFSCSRAAFREASFSEAIRSAMDSAWERSIRPFIKALMVNSPALAVLAPFFSRTSKIFFAMCGEPWKEISAEFSAVKVLGAWNTETITSSITSSPSFTKP